MNNSDSLFVFIREKIDSIPILGKIIGVIIAIGTIVFFINETVEKLFEVDLLEKLRAFIKQIPQKRIKNLRDDYYKTLNNKNYHTWQLEVLKKIYPDIDFVKIDDQEYPITCLESKPLIKYKFEELLKKEFKLELQNPSFNKSIHKRYKQILEGTIKYPKRIGFLLQTCNINTKTNSISISSKLGTYDQTVYSSHILEYELFRFYKKKKDTKKLTREKILDHLPLRKDVHNNQLGSENILLNGNNRFATLGIQMFLIFKDHLTNTYKIPVILRSNKVALRQGQYQLIPAGMFEIFPDEITINDSEIISKNYNVTLALFRELLEEAYGKIEYEDNSKGEAVDNIMNHPIILKIDKYIKEKNATFGFLGCVIDLINLRHDLSFILRIDDSEFSKSDLIHNWEALRSIETCCIPEVVTKKENLTPVSAGLFHLALSSEVLEGINDKK